MRESHLQTSAAIAVDADQPLRLDGSERIAARDRDQLGGEQRLPQRQQLQHALLIGPEPGQASRDRFH